MNKSEKKEAALNLADSSRLEQLRQLGKSRSEEEQREFSRLYQKSRRIEQRAQLRGEKSPHDKFADASEFWGANRLLLPKKKLDEYLAQREQVLDIEYWMENGFNCDPSDPDFVSLEEGLGVITEHTFMFGTIYDDPIDYKQHPVLQDTGPLLWALRDTKDPIHGWCQAFFKSAERFNVLCSESPVTEIYARYGIKTALSAYNIRTFKQRITEHERAKVQPDVRRAHLETEKDCWLCKQWWCSQEGQQPQAPLEPSTPTA